MLRDARTFTVADPRFTTARVVGPSMLSLDGRQHARHRAPFHRAFRPQELERSLAGFAATRADELAGRIATSRSAEIRTAIAGPLAAAVMAQALGLTHATPAAVLAWYADIVTAVSSLAAAPAGATAPGSFASLAAALRASMSSGRASLLADAAAGGDLTEQETVSNAAVLLFGGIETTEGMITNALWYLLSDAGRLSRVLGSPALLPAAIEESLRIEPAAAMVDRYATADTSLGGARIAAGDQVTVSIAGANRDPAVFADPDAFDIGRAQAARHLAFARGPHFCVGADLARLETLTALRALLDRLPGLRLDPGRSEPPRGLVFRKPPALHVTWD